MTGSLSVSWSCWYWKVGPDLSRSYAVSNVSLLPPLSPPLLPLLKHDVATVTVPKPPLQVIIVNIIIIILSDLEAAGETEALTLARVYEGSLEEATPGPVTQAA